jgi:hypothetical protein
MMARMMLATVTNPSTGRSHHVRPAHGILARAAKLLAWSKSSRRPVSVMG